MQKEPLEILAASIQFQARLTKAEKQHTNWTMSRGEGTEGEAVEGLMPLHFLSRTDSIS